MPHRLVVAEAEASGPDAIASGNEPAASSRASGSWPWLEPATAEPFTAEPSTTGSFDTGSFTNGPFDTEPFTTGPSTDRAVRHRVGHCRPQLDLPRRLRQASLAPQLRDTPPAGRPGVQRLP